MSTLNRVTRKQTKGNSLGCIICYDMQDFFALTSVDTFVLFDMDNDDDDDVVNK